MRTDLGKAFDTGNTEISLNRFIDKRDFNIYKYLESFLLQSRRGQFYARKRISSYRAHGVLLKGLHEVLFFIA